MEPNHHVDKDISLSIYGCYGVVILGIEVQSVEEGGAEVLMMPLSPSLTQQVFTTVCVSQCL